MHINHQCIHRKERKKYIPCPDKNTVAILILHLHCYDGPIGKRFLPFILTRNNTLMISSQLTKSVHNIVYQIY